MQHILLFTAEKLLCTANLNEFAKIFTEGQK
jgi:hypothetical protein